MKFKVRMLKGPLSHLANSKVWESDSASALFKKLNAGLEQKISDNETWRVYFENGQEVSIEYVPGFNPWHDALLPALHHREIEGKRARMNIDSIAHFES